MAAVCFVSLMYLARRGAPGPQINIGEQSLRSRSEIACFEFMRAVLLDLADETSFAHFSSVCGSSIPSCAFLSHASASKACADFAVASANAFDPLPPLDLTPLSNKPVSYFTSLQNTDSVDADGFLHMGPCPASTHPAWEYYGHDDSVSLWTKPVYVLEHDIVHSFCANATGKYRGNYFNKVRYRPSVHERARAIVGPNWVTDGIAERPNVLVFMLDCMSRGAFFREMPKFAQVVIDHVDTSEDAILLDFQRLNIVGRTSQGNKIPFVSGERAEDYNAHKTLWEDFADSGYVTQVAEAIAFPEQYSDPADVPPDVWGEPTIFNALTPSNPIFSKIDHVWNSRILLPNTGNNDCMYGPGSFRGFAGQSYCIGPKPRNHYLREHLNHFWELYHDVPKFAYVNPLDAHDPTHYSGNFDDDLAEWFQEYVTQWLPDTVVVLMGDHGMAYGPQLLEGMLNRLESMDPDQEKAMKLREIEHKNPLLMMIVPHSFSDKHPALYTHLFSNQPSLVSMFDLHGTLRHISLLSTAAKVSACTDSAALSSLLCQTYPANRTAAEARVPQWYYAPNFLKDWRGVQDDSIIEPFLLSILQEFNSLTGNGTGPCVRFTRGNITAFRIEQLNRMFRAYIAFYHEIRHLKRATYILMFDGENIVESRQISPFWRYDGCITPEDKENGISEYYCLCRHLSASIPQNS